MLQVADDGGENVETQPYMNSDSLIIQMQQFIQSQYS